jgi:serine/tyrosine/threonine adenylyltransferase
MSLKRQPRKPLATLPAMIPTPFHPSTLPWLNRYAALGQPFAHHQPGQALPDPRWVATSDAAAVDLGWPADWWTQPGALAAFSAGVPWPGMQTSATVYSGHQFGVWAGQLGDGRALLLGEVDGPNGPRELQLKGSGMTPYSRRADGRAVLRSSIREFLCSEAMHALGIATTRALALVASDLPVRRETVETAAIVTRTAPSFLRFGHAEHFCHHAQHGGRGDFSALQRLIDCVIDHHYPHCRDAAQPAAALLAEIAQRTAVMVAGWQAVGFCHGVMNTDNLSLLGLTIDYGPFGFLDGFDPMHICNHSDDQGRYAYARQPQVAYWNLHALAQALVPLIDGGEGDGRDERVKDVLTEALSHYPDIFARQLGQHMRAKLGLLTEQPDDQALSDDLLRLMARHRVDYTLTWRLLGEHRVGMVGAAQPEPVRDLFLDGEGFDAWVLRYDARLRAEHSVDAERQRRMHAVNPKFILRNHLAELAIRQAEAGDYAEVQRLHRVLTRPFDDQPEHAAYAALPPEWAGSLEISCSS